MKKFFADSHASIEAHTVKVEHVGFVPGFLVRCTRSNRELGRIWEGRNNGVMWYWRTPTGSAFGERSTQAAAVRVLRDVYDVTHKRAATDDTFFHAFEDAATPSDKDILDAWRSVEPTKTRAARPVTPSAPVAPVVRKAPSIKWNDDAPAFDVTSAIRDGLKGKV
jgi:hypothetical protein